MERYLARLLFIILGLILGCLLVWLINLVFRGKIELNLFNAVNGFLVIGLGYNIVFGLMNQEMLWLTMVNVPLITGMLFWRNYKYNKLRKDSNENI